MCTLVKARCSAAVCMKVVVLVGAAAAALVARNMSWWSVCLYLLACVLVSLSTREQPYVHWVSITC